jgi:hypothetical protein
MEWRLSEETKAQLGGMAERTNATVLKVCQAYMETSAAVGCNRAELGVLSFESA